MRLVLMMAFAGMLAVPSAAAAPVFTGGLAIAGAAHDQTGSSANTGRLGFFSDLYYDASRKEWWALADRGPGGGTISYETRIERFTLDIDPVSGRIANFKIAGTVKFSRKNAAFNGLAPNPKSSLGQSLDPEGLVVAPNGHFYVSDEYGPSVYEFSRDGDFIRAFEIPANIIPRDASGKPNFADDKGNAAGRKSNRGFEGLAISPDGKFVFAILQSAMLDEGGKEGHVNRIVKFSTASGKAVAQYAYAMESAGLGRGVSALLALNDHQFLVLERNNRGLGVGAELSPPVKQIFKIDLNGASDVSAIPLTAGSVYTPVSKTAWLDITSGSLPELGGKQPEKFEGLALGPVLKDGTRLLVIGTDNDFSVTQNDAGEQFDVYFNMADADPDASAIKCPLDRTLGCTRLSDGSPAPLSASYALLPGVLYAFKVAAGDLK